MAISHNVIAALILAPIGTILTALAGLTLNTVIATKDETREQALEIDLLEIRVDSQARTITLLTGRVEDLERENRALRRTRLFIKPPAVRIE